MFLSGCQPLEVTSGGESSGGVTSTGEVFLSHGAVASGYSTTRGTGGETTGTSAGTSSSTGEPQVPDLPFLPAECAGDVLTGDIFDPKEVYILGTLKPGTCGRNALSHWSTPDHVVLGLGCAAGRDTAAIRPTDGRILYADQGDGVRRFHCDICPWVPDSDPREPYIANDPIINSCPGQADYDLVLIAPDIGHLYHCAGTWSDALGEPRYAEEFGELLHLGHDGWALTETGVVNLENGSFAGFIDLPASDLIAVRADPAGGFFVATRDEPELFHVGLDGHVVSMGHFPPLPPESTAYSDAALDACLALYQIGRAPEDVIFRRAIGDETRIVYTEATDPIVKLHISELVTGP